MGKKNYNSIKYITLDEHTKNHMNDDKLSTARAEKSFKAEIGAKPKFHKGKYGKKYDTYTCGNCGSTLKGGVSENYCCNCGYKIIWDSPRCLTKYENMEEKKGEKGITADKNFARLRQDMIWIAEKNWTDSQVKMLKGLICAAANGVEYSDAYEAVNKD